MTAPGRDSRRTWPALLVTVVLLAASGMVSAANEYVPPSSEPEHLYPFNGHAYFSAMDGVHGRELWRVDVDGNPELVKDITPGPEGTVIKSFCAFKGQLYFRAGSNGKTGDLWRTDGTPGGTALFKEAGGKDPGLDINVIIGDNGERLFFGLGVERSNSQLWSTDGTAAGTAPVTGIDTSHTLGFEQFHGAFAGRFLYLGAKSTRPADGVWRTDGTPEGTEFIKTLQGLPGSFMALDDQRVVFAGDGGGEGHELWITSGTDASTTLLKDIYPGPESSDPGECCLVADGESGTPKVLFAATHPDFGRELWETDGTPDGTRLWADVLPGTGSSNPFGLKARAGSLYFVANGEGVGTELWYYPGIQGLPEPIADINPGLPGSDPYEVCLTDHGVLYFSALDPVHGEEFWQYKDGSGGPVLFADIYPGAGSSFPYYTVNMNNRVLTVATDPVVGRELWIIDAVDSRLLLLADIYTDSSVNPSSFPHEMTAAGDLLFFAANDIAHGNELWRSDGTHGGTVLVRDIFPGSASSNPEELAAAGDLLYFSADDGVHGAELWRSDGTLEGTALVMDIDPDGSANPSNLTVLKGALLFSARRPYEGDELWILEAGKKPVILADIAPGKVSSKPDHFFAWKGFAYFQADDSMHGRELWRTDGTTKGTVMVRDIVDAPYENISFQFPCEKNGVLYFAADMGGRGTELWALDESQTRILPVRDIAIPAAFDVLNPAVP